MFSRVSDQAHNPGRKRKMLTPIVCDSCGKTFCLSSDKIYEGVVENTKISVSYFVCPKCKKVYSILIRDEKFNALQNDYIKTKERYEKLYKKYFGKNEGEELLSQVFSSMLSKHQRLRQYEESLTAKVNKERLTLKDGKLTLLP